jgi:hypothetical protein
MRPLCWCGRWYALYVRSRPAKRFSKVDKTTKIRVSVASQSWPQSQRHNAVWVNKELVLTNADFSRELPRFLNFFNAAEGARRR